MPEEVTRCALVADAEAPTRKHTADILQKSGWAVETVATPQAVQDLIVRKAFNLALIDSALAGTDGLQFLERIKSLRPDGEIIITTSTPNVDEAVEAIRRGAIDYITQPVAVERLLTCIEHLGGRSTQKPADQSPRSTQVQGAKTFISGNPEMLELLEAAAMVAGTKATILITGESGTGKEVLAAHIHRVANKADQPFVAVNCAALPDTLIESELFGHEKG
nr:sigma 54-interacting transcriptional regulator [Desulfobacterales bacterium]